jgi:prevent-host-death family protein
MKIVNVHAAKTNLSRLIEQACAGEEIVIARDNRPVVRLVPVESREPRKQFGSMQGLIAIGPEFFEPLPAHELEEWEE